MSAMPVCQCLEKFKPKSVEAWNTMDWSQGCVRNKELECQKGDGFIKLDGLKVPDATDSWVNKTMNLKKSKAFYHPDHSLSLIGHVVFKVKLLCLIT
jgi:hypothetical protein